MLKPNKGIGMTTSATIIDVPAQNYNTVCLFIYLFSITIHQYVHICPIDRCCQGKGTIVDSGTTDSYLPSSIAHKFNSIFQDITGMKYHNKPSTLTTAQFEALPVLVFKLEGVDGAPVTIHMPPESYSEVLGPDKYAFRIYVNEPAGSVLGANFMNNQNLLFDIDRRRIGFSASSCGFKDVVVVKPADDADQEVEVLFNKSNKKKAPKVFVNKPAPSAAQAPPAKNNVEGTRHSNIHHLF